MTRTAAELRMELRAFLEARPTPLPPFEFRVGWSRTYEDLLSSRFDSETEIQALLTTANEYGRVILHGRGGGAKTVILERLAQLAVTQGAIGLWGDFRKWATSDQATWANLRDRAGRLDFLLSRCAVPVTSTALLSALEPEVRKVLFWDGLNEVSSSIARDLLEALSEFVIRVPASAVIVSDRVVRRELNPLDTWQLARVLPLATSQIREQLQQELGDTKLLDTGDPTLASLLSTPYYLDAALNDEIGADTHAIYFERHVQLSQDELHRASGAAFDAYRRNQSRTFRLRDFELNASREVMDRLLQAEALVTVGEERAQFAHHLKHDYLVARYVAEDETRWNDDTFDAATLRAASFEALAMALQLMPSSKQGDSFVRRIYDWNFYGAAYAVAEGRHWGEARVSTEMETILLAMLADRRWDLITATVERVTDALRLFENEVATRFLNARAPEEVVGIVQELKSEDRGFLAWRSVFVRHEGDVATDAEIESLSQQDSLLGWTLANVLKRLRLTEGQQKRLRRLTSAQAGAVRWRVVHLLGAFPTKGNARVLLSLFERDPYLWVRYGAVRSLLEMAARADTDLRGFIFQQLARRTSELTSDERLRQEFERAIVVDETRAPEDWLGHVLSLLKVLHDRETTIERRDHWEGVAYKVRGAYLAIA